jgi:hypothetical protein
VAQRWALVVALLALASVVLSAHRFVDVVQGFHRDSAGLTEAERDESAVEGAGLQVATWVFVRSHLQPSDRYAIVTPARLGAGFHRYMQTFAGYWLLPAVAATGGSADVRVYLRERGPRGAACREVPQLVCVQRRS